MERPRPDALQWAVFGVLAVTAVALGARLVVGPTDAVLVGATAVVAALLVVTIRAPDLTALSVGKDGLRAELTAVREHVEAVDRKVAQLFLLTMSPAMYLNLAKLAGGHFGPYELTGGLERELVHLRDIGYIETQPIRQIPAAGPDLSAHVRATEQGRRFVALRGELEQELGGGARPPAGPAPAPDSARR